MIIMGLRKTICPNHGVIESVEIDCMWLKGPPAPANYCPKCGARTVVEYPEKLSYAMFKTPTEDERRAAKNVEIEHYRKIYWPDRKFD